MAPRTHFKGRDSNCYTTVTFGVAGYSEAFHLPINGICEAIALLFTVLSASEGLRKNFFWHSHFLELRKFGRSIRRAILVNLTQIKCSTWNIFLLTILLRWCNILSRLGYVLAVEVGRGARLKTDNGYKPPACTKAHWSK